MHPKRSATLVTTFASLAPLAAAMLLSACFGWGDGQQSTIRPATDSARIVQRVYTMVTWIDVGIFLLVAGLLAFAVIRYRARPGQSDDIPRQVHGNAAMELVWTIIPAVLLIFIAVPTWSAIFRAAAPPTEGALTIRATGHQWWWEFRYPGEGLVTANELYLPLGRAVVVETNSVDVIHSFWVPKLSGKIDSLPGQINKLWFTPQEEGMFYGQCAEFCGTSHANMRFRVHVVSPEAFERWVAETQRPPAPQSEDAKAGEQLFVQKGCIACHAITGVPAAVGVLGPNLTNLAARTSLAAGILENTPENMVRWIRYTQDVKPGARMGVADPEQGGFRPIDMTDGEAGRIAAYLVSPPGEPPAMAPAAEQAAAMTGAAEREMPIEQLIQEKLCIACHTIPGIPTAVGTVGPSLAGLMSRAKIAGGLLDNTPENLARWLANPRAIKKDSVMTTPPLSEGDIAALVKFLTTLK
jgi:cytochrome c oxidase subunit 2